MKIAVCIKQVPGTTQVEIDPETGTLKRDGVPSKLNAYDLYALETALRLKALYGGEITALTMGPPQAQAVLREAFMMGVDHGVLISDRKFGGADVLATSYTLSQGIRAAGDFDLVLTGKQTTDGDTAQVGAELAEFLGIAHVANVTALGALTDGVLELEQDMPRHVLTVQVKLPALLAVEKGIFQPRLPSYKLKKATADRGIRVISLAEMPDSDPSHYGLNGSPTQVKRIFPPESTVVRENWEGDGVTLAARLQERLVAGKFMQKL